jgi:hypothetical protein
MECVSQGLKPRVWVDGIVRAEARTYLRSKGKKGEGERDGKNRNGEGGREADSRRE